MLALRNAVVRCGTATGLVFLRRGYRCNDYANVAVCAKQSSAHGLASRVVPMSGLSQLKLRACDLLPFCYRPLI